MDGHEELLGCFDSAYDLYKRTGITYPTAKRYWRTRVIADWKSWQQIARAAGRDNAETYHKLATEQR